MAAVVACVAQGQAFRVGVPKLVDKVVGAPVRILATTADSAGDRYVCGVTGIGSATTSYAAKFSSRGQLIWSRTLSVDRMQRASAVKFDGLGNLYVGGEGTRRGSGEVYPSLIKLSPSTGATIWKEIAPVRGLLYDLAFLADGRPISVGMSDSFDGVTRWNLAGTDPTFSDDFHIEVYGTLTSVAVGANGCVYVGGTMSDSSNYYVYGFAVFSPDLSVHSAPQLITTGGKVFDIQIDPVSDRAVINGWEGTGGASGVIQVVRANYDAGTHTLNYDYSTERIYGIFAGGLTVQSAQLLNGRLFALVNFGVKVGPSSCGLFVYDISPDNQFNIAWSAAVPGFGGSQLGAELVVHDGNVSVVSVNQSSVAFSDGNYQPYELATWSLDGTPLKRRILSDAKHPAPGMNWQVMPKDLVTFANGSLSFYGSTGFVNGVLANNGIWSATSLAGPADKYKTAKNQPLIWSTLTGSLMENDCDGFSLNLTCALRPGSLIQLASATVNPDGTFTVTPRPGFAGKAAFSYDVYDGPDLIATHEVTVRVLNDGVPPVAGPDSFHVPANSGGGPIDVLWNDVDSGELRVIGKTNGAFGQVTVAPDGKYVSYKPKKGFVGTDTFTYTIRNLAGDTAVGTVTVTVGH